MVLNALPLSLIDGGMHGSEIGERSQYFADSTTRTFGQEAGGMIPLHTLKRTGSLPRPEV